MVVHLKGGSFINLPNYRLLLCLCVAYADTVVWSRCPDVFLSPVATLLGKIKIALPKPSNEVLPYQSHSLAIKVNEVQ